jgi:hypothetical protein
MKDLKQSGSGFYACLTRWQTSDECRFIEGLGSWSKYRHTEKERIALLKKYKASMVNRKEWGQIDPAKIKVYVDQCLKKGGETDGEAKAGNR